MEKRFINIILFLFIILFFAIYLLLFVFFRSYIFKNFKTPLLSSEQSRIQTVNCDPALGNIQQCSNVGDICLQCKDSAYSCQEVFQQDSDKYQIYDQQGNRIGNISPGKWCLPVKVDSAKCNDFTSIPVLTKISDNEYMWRCYCKYPQWVTSSGLNSDCDIQIACNHQDNPSENYLAYCPDGSQNCKPEDLIPWTPNSDIDLENTSCHCETGSHYYNNPAYNVKLCLKDPCGGGGVWDPTFGDNGDCVCNKGYVNVNFLPPNHRAEYNGIGCIKDPCGDHGTFNVPTKDNPNYCICENEDQDDGYEFLADNNYVTNGYCQKKMQVCDVNNNLAAQDCADNGGLCKAVYVDSGYTGKIPIPQCYNCLPPFGFRNEKTTDQDVTCNPVLLPFVSCSKNQDQTCSTGRCHSTNFLGVNTGNQCLPCNEPGKFIEYQNSDDQKDLQNDWDDECASIDKDHPGEIGGKCNLYEFTDSNGNNLYPDYGKYLGFCQRDPCSANQPSSKVCKRFD